MSRPCKLTPETAREIVSLISAGNYMETAAAAAGISKDTLYVWLRRGARAATGKFRTFRDDVLRAQAKAEAASIARITLASQTTWQAAAWRLERMHPDRFARRIPEEANEARAEDLAKEFRDAVKKMRGATEPEPEA